MSEFIKIVGTIFGGASKNDASQHNAQVNERNAVLARGKAASDEARQRRLGRRQKGAIRAAIGASGITVDGSALDVIEDSAQESELDALTIRHRGEVEAAGFRGTAQLDRARGRSEFAGSIFSAAGELLD